MEEEKKELIEEEVEESSETEETSEVVETEVVDAEVVESEEPKSEQPVEPEEVFDPGIVRTLTIEEETYGEFFSRNSLKQQLKTSIFIIVVIWVILYLLRGEATIQQYLIQCAIYTAAFLVITILFTLFTTKVFVKRNYKRSQLDGLQIEVRFNKQGITQSIGEQSAMTPWTEISSVDESETSLFFYAGSRRAIILSKKNLMPGDIEVIRSIAKTGVGEDNYHIFAAKKSKKKDDFDDHNRYDDEIK